MKKRLCISIPTYNRCTFLDAALHSIVVAALGCEQDVEVRIYDNASEDQTESIGRSYASKYPWILYFRNPTNIGGHPNFEKALRENECDYVWVLGDDDRLVPAAIRTVLHATEKNYGVIILNFSKHTSDFSHVIAARTHAISNDIALDPGNTIEVCGSSIGFLSANVVRRELASRVPQARQREMDEEAGCGFALCVYAAAIFGRTGLMVAEPIVQQCCGNGYLQAGFWSKHALKYCDTLTRVLPGYGYDARATARYFRRRKIRDMVFRVLSDIYRGKPMEVLISCAKPYFRSQPVFFGLCRLMASITPHWLVVAVWRLTHRGAVLT
jgi:glycosyltransferase involved in cell wall biosynthesis